MWDYGNKAGVALFARALVNVVKQNLGNGAPVLDYLFLDGPSSQNPFLSVPVCAARALNAAGQSRATLLLR